MKRGDIVTVAVSGAYGKPRPAVIIQSDLMADSDSVIVCLITSDVVEGVEQRRVNLAPDADNGLRRPSQIMIEKIVTLPRAKTGGVIGALDVLTVDRLNAALALVIGLAE